MIHLLPTNLKDVANLCAKDPGSSRFGATTGIQLEIKDGTYHAVATDGRRLIAVEGETEKGEYPGSFMDGAPNGELSSVVPGKTWIAALAKAEKLCSKRGVSEALRGKVAVSMGTTETTIGATNLENTMMERTRNVEGRFPNWRNVVPLESKAEYRCAVDPFLLAETLVAVGRTGTNEETKRVVLEFHGDAPMVIRAANHDLPKVTGVVVPLVASKDNKAHHPNGAANTRRHQIRFDRLLAALRKIQGDNTPVRIKDIADKLEHAEKGWSLAREERNQAREMVRSNELALKQLLALAISPESFSPEQREAFIQEGKASLR